MINRRKLLKTIGLGVGACSLTPFFMQLKAEAANESAKPAQRFVFVIRSNGVLTNEIAPQGLKETVPERPHPQQFAKWAEVSLADHELPAGMKPLEKFKDKLTLIQGLSGRMISGQHEGGFGVLGAYNGKRSPRDETIDWALARHLGGVVPHIGFTMDNIGTSVTYPDLSAAGPRKPLPYYADPMLAYTDLFGTIATSGQAKASLDIERNILDQMVHDVKRYQKSLSSREKEKLGRYLEGFETLQARQRKLRTMHKELAAAAPELNAQFKSEVEIERLKAHFDLAASSLVAGLTNVCTIRCEHLGMRLGGLGLGNKTVHEIGHMIQGKGLVDGGNRGEAFNGDTAPKDEFQTRQLIMNFHMQQIAQLYDKLKSIPQGDGTLADNTTIVYFSDHGDRHHSPFYLWPMTILRDCGGAFKTGRYLQYPGHRQRGNQTLGNFYLSLLHAAGDYRKTFGQPDLESPDYIKQNTPLEEWMA